MPTGTPRQDYLSHCTARVLLVDDQELVRTGLRLLIEKRTKMSVVGEAAGWAQALALAQDAKPDVIVMELALASDSGFDLIPALMASNPKLHVIVLTRVKDPEAHRVAVRLGAADVIVKDQPSEVLLRAIEKTRTAESPTRHSAILEPRT